MVVIPAMRAFFSHATSSRTPLIISRSYSSARKAGGARPRRAWLYVPASSPKMMGKAQRLGADTVCLDLEDGVAVSAKELARNQVIPVLRSACDGAFGRSEVAARINPLDSLFGKQDIESLLRGEAPPDAVVLPKVERAEDVWFAHERLSQFDKPPDIIVLVESPAALLSLDEICTASPLLTALIFGGDDYAASVGATRTPSNMELSFARNMMLLHAARYGLQAIDIVNIRYKTAGGMFDLQKEAHDACNLGFCGKQLIHPTQVPYAHAAFAPSQDAVCRAQAIISHSGLHENRGVGAFELNGEMIDAPTVKQAEKLLARARACDVI